MRSSSTRRFWLVLALLAFAMITIPLVPSLRCHLRARTILATLEAARLRAQAERRAIALRAEDLLAGSERLVLHGPYSPGPYGNGEANDLPFGYRMTLPDTREWECFVLSLHDASGHAFAVDVTHRGFGLAVSLDGRELTVGSHLSATRATTR